MWYFQYNYGIDQQDTTGHAQQNWDENANYTQQGPSVEYTSNKTKHRQEINE